ncbi:MAG: tRNA dihydrouridine synthase DusB [Rickettsiales bacterium]|jgi:tRNA-dihydrouridine synthase B|nr:tRNA dihydrouridine synthase DusB [Rickettsiales bacterium]
MFAPLHLKNLIIRTPVFAAPLAGITDWPYRQILRKCAPAAPLLTEMISSHSLIENRKKNLKTNCNRNFDNYAEEGLIGAQIFGADPEIMAEAAKILEQNGASWIDVNMGCPVPKVATRAGAGAFLMRDHKLAGQIVAKVAAAVRIPVSVKTRLGWDAQHLDSNTLLCIAAENGAQFATVHGRTRAQAYAGTADWRQIAECKEQIKIKDFPIIFNGDIKTAADIRAVEKLGADGAMIGRALLGKPWMLGRLANNEQRGTIGDLILEHFHLTLEYYGERAGVPLFRKHAAWYSGGASGAAQFRTQVNRITRAIDMEKAITEFFCCALAI